MEFEEVCDATELPEALPILPVRDAVIFPYMTIPLQIAREISMQALERALKEQRMLLLLSQKNARQDDPGPEDLYTTGTVCMIVRMLKEDDGRVKVLVQGLAKARVREIVFEEPHLFCKIDVIREPMLSSIPIEVEALMRSVRDTLDDFLGTKNLPNEILMLTENINDPGVLADLIAANLNLRVPEAQRLLECTDPVQRLEKVGEELHREIELTRMQTRIQSQAKEEISRTQREYYLREQLKAIQGELGDLDEKSDDIQSLRQQVESAGMPPEAEKEALKQLRRLDTMNIESAEASIVRGYLDWLVELPWSHSTQDNLDIKEVQRVLDEDHYNLKQVKDRILEYLSVRKLKEKMRGPILCFVGPPGVGKTSLGRSIARAMGREFVRVSIGGVHDEAEIRGHRRTYVGALPGRVIQGIKQVGSNNPVFMIDEVDKIGNDYRGDPASALLEVLDPEQNNRFSDHYLNIPFDLSKVMFITTANRLDLIPPTLRDRMEVIRISGYTEEEKVRIATTYLLPRQLDENGLTPENLVLSMSALRKTISEYTQEAGLRELERKINQVCRKVARRIAEEEGTSFRASVGTLHHYLGSPRFLPDEEQNHPQVGQAMGLAWTQAGGEVLCVEVSVVSGSGELTLTGQLGDVMKESARAALSYARASARKWGIPKDFYKSSDVHIHVPAGAIPKDGPSAGVAMAASLVSALTGRPVRHDVAMTGEITLRGRVLLVGGVKEKVLGAHRGKMTEVFLPSRNLRDLADIPSAVRKRVKLNFVNHVEEILDQVLLQETPKEAYDTGDIRIVKKALPLTGSEGCLE
jgi:ATP-dependent Lon protease